ncbi:hypothetical protein [Polyangium aurulentum]|uniref:hypothetical protein n=1 Tax=Polyangium aurulentum TaxID=2567896 RepID=UPI0010ADA763|nr:hypothetical protein [Polyangium aurulentum]UQA56185.1 hypothetical protein E8A73_033440 [Polyangium aurulentum]
MKKTSRSTEIIPFRLDPALKRLLDEHARSVADVSGASFDRSAYIRDCVGFDLTMWRKSPYTAAHSQNYILVTRDGAFVFHRREHLRLNEAPDQVRVGIEMKHEKIRDYLRRGDASALARAFRLNMFVCRIPKAHGESVTVKNDIDGVTSKSVEFDMRRVATTDVTVETMTILEDYVQRQAEGEDGRPDDSPKDEAYVDVEVPTELLELVVVVDRDLYQGDSRRLHPFPKLRFELKNTRGAQFDRESVLSPNWNKKRALVERIHNSWDLDAPRAGDRLYTESVERAQAWIGELDGAMRACREGIVSDGGDRSSAELLADLDAVLGDPGRYVYVPKQASFYRLLFRHCRMGLRLSITWTKPERAAR